MQYFYEHESLDYSYNVGAKFKDGKLLISDWALGDVIEKTHIDSDIEHYITISAAHVYRFVRACSDWAMHKKPKKDSSESDMIKILHEIFQNDKDTIFKIKDILKRNDIPYDFQVW